MFYEFLFLLVHACACSNSYLFHWLWGYSRLSPESPRTSCKKDTKLYKISLQSGTHHSQVCLFFYSRIITLQRYHTVILLDRFHLNCTQTTCGKPLKLYFSHIRTVVMEKILRVFNESAFVHNAHVKTELNAKAGTLLIIPVFFSRLPEPVHLSQVPEVRKT